jgi:hypothetical protein
MIRSMWPTRRTPRHQLNSVERTAARKILIGGLPSCAEAVGAVADFPDVQGRGLDNAVAIVKLVDQNVPLRG